MAGKRKINRWLLAGAILAGLAAGVTLGLILAVGRGLPQIEALEQFEPGAVTRVMSADGLDLAEFFAENRRPLALSEIPVALRRAVVAVEDHRFYRHYGVDFVRTLGALIADIRAGKMVEGGSTITQQLARNLFLTSQKTLRRKLKEIFLALQIEQRYTKDEILKLYLNQVYFGSGSYGVGAAAQTYFDKPVSALTPGECALLAGLLQSPERYSPFKYPKKALGRRQTVLRAMVREGFLNQEQASGMAKEPLRLANRMQGPEKAQYFIQYVRNFLVEEFGWNAVYKGGLTVRTTLNMDMQLAAEKAAVDGRRRLEADTASYRAGPDKEETPQVALAALDKDGGVLAWVGGTEYNEESLDRVASLRRPPGSVMKPLIYAAAIEKGFTQADRVWDAPVSYDLPDRSKPWRPQNYSHRYEGEITLRRALEISENIPAVKLLSQIGVDGFIATARRLGVTSPLARDLTLALGQSEVSLLEMLGAYHALAGGGLWVEPYVVSEVKDRSGRVIYQSFPDRRAALSPETAYIVTDMLQGVVNTGVAQRAKALDRVAAGLPGTSPDNRDVLFLGYTPEITAGVWVGFDSGRSLGPEMTGARAALPIWVDFLGMALQDRPVGEFQRPVGIVMAYMDRMTGAGVRPGEPGAVRAAFRQGAQPRPAPDRP